MSSPCEQPSITYRPISFLASDVSQCHSLLLESLAQTYEGIIPAAILRTLPSRLFFSLSSFLARLSDPRNVVWVATSPHVPHQPPPSPPSPSSPQPERGRSHSPLLERVRSISPSFVRLAPVSLWRTRSRSSEPEDVVGFAAGTIEEDENGERTVSALYVREGFQRLRIGSSLMAGVVGTGKANLVCLEENWKARKFYEKAGFK